MVFFHLRSRRRFISTQFISKMILATKHHLFRAQCFYFSLFWGCEDRAFYLSDAEVIACGDYCSRFSFTYSEVCFLGYSAHVATIIFGGFDRELISLLLRELPSYKACVQILVFCKYLSQMISVTCPLNNMRKFINVLMLTTGYLNGKQFFAPHHKFHKR